MCMAIPKQKGLEEITKPEIPKEELREATKTTQLIPVRLGAPYLKISQIGAREFFLNIDDKITTTEDTGKGPIASLRLSQRAKYQLGIGPLEDLFPRWNENWCVAVASLSKNKKEGSL